MFIRYLILLIVISLTTAEDVSQQTLPSPVDEFCSRYPFLNLCQLRSTLEGSLMELAQIQSHLVVDDSQDAPEDLQMEKRKSTFVRFGKRSAAPATSPEEEPSKMEEKRKSTFVRFGKRKSSYVRFG